ncbi:unnamed protein product, partial [Vitis vinifera]
MRKLKAILGVLLLWFLCSTILRSCRANNLVCNEKEKQALLSFKHALLHPANQLSSWSIKEDCCGWRGVHCSNVTARVLKLELADMNLGVLDLSENKINQEMPNWLFNLSSLASLSLSDNQFKGQIPESLGHFKYLEYLDLSSNSFHGPIPTSIGNLSSLRELNLYYNRLNGTLPTSMGRLSNLMALALGHDSLTGAISEAHFTTLSNLKTVQISETSLFFNMNGTSQLEVLDISINALSGEISDCWMHWQSLTHINMGSNNLSGKIPNSMGSLVGLKALSLHNNSFYGDVPSSLENCKVLGLINLSDNKFSGIIPRWIVERTTVMVIHLRTNKFNGIIPPQICQLSSLIVLDLADNSLSGEIPKCLNNFSAMAEGPIRGQYDILYDALEAEYDYESYMESLVLDIKGRESEYKEILKYVRAIDLSSNNLSGSIPVEIFSLSGLQLLNLSCNHLRGMISAKIGGMEYLESLDLSRNHLSGEIPQSIANLTFLSYLNVSYNKFSGKIPSSTQLQSLDPLYFFGNAELCGAPLSKNCTKDEEPQDTNTNEESGEHPEIAWFYIGMGTGFVVGFWGVCGALFFKRSWRHAYFRVLDDMKDRVYVVIALRFTMFKGSQRKREGNGWWWNLKKLGKTFQGAHNLIKVTCFHNFSTETPQDFALKSAAFRIALLIINLVVLLWILYFILCYLLLCTLY